MFQLTDLEQVLNKLLWLLHIWTDIRTSFLSVYLLWHYGVLHNLLQQMKKGMQTDTRSLGSGGRSGNWNGCPTFFLHGMHFLSTWLTLCLMAGIQNDWRISVMVCEHPECKLLLWISIITKLVNLCFLGSKTGYFAESCKEELSILPLQRISLFSSR